MNLMKIDARYQVSPKKMKRNVTLKHVVESDLMACLFVTVSSLLIQFGIGDLFVLDRQGDFMLWRVVNAVFPSWLIYSIIRFLAPNLLAALMVSALELVLSIANKTKIINAGEPLSWSDLASLDENMFIAQEFFRWWHFVIVLLVVLMAVYVYRMQPLRKLTCAKVGVLAVSVICLGFFVVDRHLSFRKMSLGGLVEAVSAFKQRNGIGYMRAQWQRNYRQNGLLNHLIQTGARVVPAYGGDQEKSLARALVNDYQPLPRQTRKIIVVLCEACWYNTKHFDSLFLPLIEAGFSPFRAISPIFGGGTVNASFELLTGLPSSGKLPGIIYQEYADLFRDEMEAMPAGARRNGYSTVAAHNYRGRFWRRNVVKYRLGFDSFISIENMPPSLGREYFRPGWPDDALLFDSVKDLVASDDPLFIYMTTMRTHAPYRSIDGDEGVADYRNRLAQVMQRVIEFTDPLVKSGDATILVIGDHKPGMTAFFDRLKKEGSLDESIYEVPALIYHPDRDWMQNFSRRADGSPFYCVGYYFNDYFVGARTLPFAYTSHERICEDEDGSRKTVERYPEWLFAHALFRM